MPWDKLNEWSKQAGQPGFVQPQQQGPVPVNEMPEVEIAPDPQPTYATAPQEVRDYILRNLRQTQEKYRAPFHVPVPKIKN